MLFRTPRNHLTKIVKANSRNFKKNWIFAIMGETEKELASSNISTCSLGFSDREEENDKMTKLHKKVQSLLNWISTSDRVFLPDCSLFLALSWMVGGYHVSDARKVWKRSPSSLELLFSLLDKTSQNLILWSQPTLSTTIKGIIF